MTALVLAGHGSSASPEVGGIVRQAAELLQQWRVADEVTCIFWKEPPYFSEAADAQQSKRMIVVPVFAARGWYVDVVLPRELARGRKDVEYTITPPVGEHPRFAELVIEALTHIAPGLPGCWPTDQSQAVADHRAVIVVGHGTSKHPGSRDTTFAIVERMRALHIAERVEPAFLDDEPSIADAVAACRGMKITAVANFIAKGSHVEDDVPKAIRDALGSDDFTYATPNVTAEEIAKMAAELAGDTELGKCLTDQDACGSSA
jgi:sirohydrochlorin cobaltochelatase